MSNDKIAMSLRLVRSLMGRVDTYAERKGLNRTAAIAVLLDQRLTEIELTEIEGLVRCRYCKTRYESIGPGPHYCSAECKDNYRAAVRGETV